MQVHALLCWSSLFACFTAAYLIPKTTEVKTLGTIVDGTARDSARLSRGSARGTTFSTLRGPATSVAVDSSRAPASSFTGNPVGGHFDALMSIAQLGVGSVVALGVGSVVDTLTKPSEGMGDVTGCFHPGACPGVISSANAPAQVTSLLPLSKTQAANNQGGLAASTEASQSSRPKAVNSAPQISPQQNSRTEQPTGSAPGQQSLSQPIHTPIVPEPKLDGTRPGEKFPSLPDPNPSSRAPNRNCQGQKPSLQSSSTLNVPTQTFNGVTPDQRFPDHAGSNSASLALQAPPSIAIAEIPKAPKAAMAPVITMSTWILTADSKQNFIINSQTLAPGSSAKVIFGNTLSLLPSASALVVNGITSPLTAAQPLTVLRNIISKEVNGPRTEREENQRATHTSAITLDNQQTLAADSVGFAIVNGMTDPLKASGSDVISTTGLVHTISELVIENQTAFPGGAPFTISGVPISLSPFGNELVVGNNTETVPGGPTLVLTVGTQIIIATKEIRSFIGDQTLTPPAAITDIAIFTSLHSGASQAVIRKTTTNVFGAGQTNQSRLEIFTGDGTTGLPELKIVAGTLFLSFLLELFF